MGRLFETAFKGKLVERRGRKATGLTDDSQGSRVAVHQAVEARLSSLRRFLSRPSVDLTSDSKAPTHHDSSEPIMLTRLPHVADFERAVSKPPERIRRRDIQ